MAFKQQSIEHTCWGYPAYSRTAGPVTDITLPAGSTLQSVEEEKGGEEVVQAWPEEARAGARAASTPASGGASSSSDGSQQEPGSVGQEGGRALHVRNVYFETVPLHLITGVITEEGCLSPEQVRHWLPACHRGVAQQCNDSVANPQGCAHTMLALAALLIGRCMVHCVAGARSS